jgi:beta-glucosidase
VEGGNDNDWSAWEQGAFPDGQPHIKHGEVSGAACESWDRFDEDLRLLKRLGANAYRFSVEWSRLEPARGVFREEVAERYRAWCRKLREAGLEPMVTLHHFTLPRWVSEAGGWERDETLDHFEAFAGRVVKRLGAEVDLWCTVNEPNVQAAFGYLKGTWPPGKQSQRDFAFVLSRLIEAHARAARQIRLHDTVDADGDGKPAKVGIAHHVRVFKPERGRLDRFIAAYTDDFFNGTVLEAVETGRIRMWLPGAVDIDRRVADLKGSFDYLGLNYYSRDHVRADLKDPSLSRMYVPDASPKNDLGWELYPEGLYLLLKRYAKLGLPIYITENGIADASGEKRAEFLRSHLYAVQRAVKEGVDVRGYFHWSLLDNFEWAEGFEPRFGLYRVDFGSPEKTRSETAGVRVFQQAAREIGLSPREP